MHFRMLNNLITPLRTVPKGIFAWFTEYMQEKQILTSVNETQKKNWG